MRIVVLLFGCDGGRSGIGRYARSLVEQWAKAPGGHQWIVFVHREDLPGLVPDPGALDLRPLPSWWPRRALLEVAWFQALRGLLAPFRPDVAFLPAGNRRLPVALPCPSVATVHDFASLHVPGKYDRARMIYIRQVLPWLMRRQDLLLTPSEATRQDVLRFTGVPDRRVRVTPLGVDHQVFRPEARRQVPALRRRLGLEAPYLLYVSRIEHPGKNHVRLVEAFETLVREGLPHHLVLAGPPWFRSEEVHRRVRESPCRDRIHLLGVFPGEDLPALYAGADLMVFPSLYEGFGLPVLEAMACGTPVACSRVSSLPEVAGEAAATFDPQDVPSIARTIGDTLGDPSRMREMARQGRTRAAGFRWEETADQTRKALEEAATGASMSGGGTAS